MPLDRAHTTSGGWTAVLGYPWFCLIVGLSFTLTDGERLRQTPGLKYAGAVIPLWLWGAGFLIVGVTLGVAILRHRRTLYSRAMSAAMLWLIVWALLMLGAGLFGEASLSAWAWPGIVAWHMWAVLQSLESRQHDIPPPQMWGST